ncbi:MULTISPECIES: mannonate dehydratase [unclassified Sinorhizobium]|uniref:mannonate dehydratase n=1 Tax=unclassified Sinorhizobium TaxID=2613772 RepID=UPI0024C3F62D|nr:MULTISPECIES: mannonate dehydratase [unclassified Sinorhizobium]MDK1373665.1 mannonate dehydratase [Sinorhizobium sp. 6-70]MDK1477774.1 mannonate dehydratase [Sinorhizobium sp. 6-117]
MPIRVGMTLSGERLNRDNAKFAQQLGIEDVVVHLGRYSRVEDPAPYLAGGRPGPILGDCSAETLWSYDYMKSVVDILGEYGLKIAAMENFAPNFWSDILLDGPAKVRQMDGLKRLVEDAARAGIKIIGYNFSIAGVWGWRRLPVGRGGAVTSVFDASSFDAQAPIPDGMVWNMRYRPAVAGAPPLTVSDAELWQRLEWFLKELVPVAEAAGVRLAAHPDDPPVETLRGTARLVNQPSKYDRLASIVDSPANALEFCVGSLQEMTMGNVYEATRRFARAKKIAYVHFRNVRGKVPHYEETFIDNGDVDMAEIIRILRDEDFDGIMVPDHVPDVHSNAPWHAGMAYTIGYMRALVAQAHLLGASKTPVSISDAMTREAV